MAYKKAFTEEKAKVVAPVWGLEFIQFLAALFIFYIPERNIMNLTVLS